MRIRVLRADDTPAAGSRVVVIRDNHSSGHDLAYRSTWEVDAEGWTAVDVAGPGSAVSILSPSGEAHEIELPAGLVDADDRTRQLLIRLYR